MGGPNVDPPSRARPVLRAAQWLLVALSYLSTQGCLEVGDTVIVLDACAPDLDGSHAVGDAGVDAQTLPDATSPDARTLDAWTPGDAQVDASESDAAILDAGMTDAERDAALDDAGYTPVLNCGGSCGVNQVCSRERDGVCWTCFQGRSGIHAANNYRVLTAADAEALRGYTEIRALDIIATEGVAELLDNLVCATRIGHLTIPGTDDLRGLRNLVTVDGDLEIAITSDATTAALSGLRSLRSVGGSFTLRPGPLKDLKGLEQLVSVRNDFTIEYAGALTTLAGIQSLATVGGTLAISGALTTLEGLEQLTQLGGLSLNTPALTTLRGLPAVTSLNVLALTRMHQLRSYDGLQSLTHVTGDMRLLDSGSATLPESFDGLQNLTSVGGDLIIALMRVSFTELTSLRSVGGDFWVYIDRGTTGHAATMAGLEQLRSVGGDFVLAGTHAEHLDGLSSLSHVGSIILQDNAELQRIDALGRLPSFMPGHVLIGSNPALTSLHGLEPLTLIGGNLAIQNNATLENIDALRNVAVIDGQLTISTNPLIPRCEAEALATRLMTVCRCPEPGLYYGTPCACDGVCNCNGNDNTATCEP